MILSGNKQQHHGIFKIKNDTQGMSSLKKTARGDELILHCLKYHVKILHILICVNKI